MSQLVLPIRLGDYAVFTDEETVRYYVDWFGDDNLVFSTDYPHVEGSHPYTREHLRNTFAEVDPDEIQQMVATNAATLYGFDLERLAPIAARVGPTKAEIAEPIALADLPERALKCPAFAADRQRPAA